MNNGAFVLSLLKGTNAALHTGPCIHPILPVNNPKKNPNKNLLAAFFCFFCLSLLQVGATAVNWYIQFIAYSQGACNYFLEPHD